MFKRTIIYLLGIVFFIITSLALSAQNLVLNPGFETGSLSPYWNSWNNALETTAVHEGNYSARTKSGVKGSVQQEITVEPNTAYEAKVWARVSNNNETALFTCGEEKTPVNTTDFKEYTLSVPTGPAQTSISLTVYKETASFGNVYVDSYSLVKTGIANIAPRIIDVGAPMLIETGENHVYTLYTFDRDHDEIILSAPTLPNWLSFDAPTGVLSGTPQTSDIGTHDVLLRASDGIDFVEKAYTITVKPAREQIAHNPQTYYVDATSGEDNNDGLSTASAWQSLAKVNATKFLPGDSILFKAGEVWTGQLHITSDGAKEAPIVYTKYGTGAKPRINGKGQELYTIRLYNADYTEVSEFDITNMGASSVMGRHGVLIETRDIGDIHGTVIRKLDIHDVNGSLDKDSKIPSGGGIYWSNNGSITSRLVDAVIEGCTIYDVVRNGIYGRADKDGSQGYNLRMRIRGNTIHSIPGDGIVLRVCENAVCEYNTCRDFTEELRTHPTAAAGIWPFQSVNTIIQHNEVSGLMGKGDAQGFDADYNCIGTIIQYNYSHDNCGGFALICANGQWDGYNDRPTIRYNISINDGFRTWGNMTASIHVGGGATNTKIYNNTIYMGVRPVGVDREFLDVTNWNGGESNFMDIKNNLFYSIAEGHFNLGTSTNNSFSHNLYSPLVEIPALENNAIVGNPRFVKVGGTDTSDYILKDASPALSAGVLIENNGGRDFFGNPVSATQVPNIGAYNGSGVNVSATYADIVDEEISQEAIFYIYPNPIVQDSIFIRITGNYKNARVSIYALSGKLLQSKFFNILNEGSTNFDISDYRGGMYLLKVETPSLSQSLKFIKR